MATNNNGNKTKLFSIIQKIKKKTMARDQERPRKNIILERIYTTDKKSKNHQKKREN